MSKGTTIRSIRVAPELWEAARIAAEEHGETLSDVIRDALRAYLAASA